MLHSFEYEFPQASIAPISSNLEVVHTDTFDPEGLRAVMRREKFAYLVEAVLSSEACREAVANLFESRDLREEKVEPRIAGIGRPLYEFEEISEYFSEAPFYQEAVNRLFPEGRHPFEEITTALRKLISSVRPAQYSSQKAFYGVVRSWEGRDQNGNAAKLHEDAAQYSFENHFPSEFELSSIRTNTHLSFVFCLENGREGGSTRVYDYVPSPNEFCDQNLRDGYGFHPEIVAATSFREFSLKAGQLLIFPGDHLHSVKAVGPDQRRVTSCMFMAETTNGDTVYWS